MTDKARPFTKEERETLLTTVRVFGTRFGGQIALEYKDHPRWEATVAAVEAERDGLEALVRFFADAATPEDFAEIMDVFTGHANLGPESDAAWAALARLAEAPKALP